MARLIESFLDRHPVAWGVGVALPIAMVVLDPAVFRTGTLGPGSPFLGAFKPFAYTAIALGVSAMGFQLGSGRFSAITAGVLAGGCVFAAALGVAILPLSLLGVLFFGLGLLGFTPFLCSIVFGWWARRGYRASASAHRTLLALAGFVLFFGLCTGLQRAASSVVEGAVRDICAGPPELASAATSRLARWQVLVDMDALVFRWSAEPDEKRQQNLAKAYRRLTGEDIGMRAMKLND